MICRDFVPNFMIQLFGCEMRHLIQRTLTVPCKRIHNLGFTMSGNAKFDNIDVEEEERPRGEHPLEAWRRRQFERQEAIDRELNQHPLFMTDQPKPGEQVSDSVAAVQAMVDECTPEEMAQNFKDSGNEAFKLGRSRWEDAIGYYTLALEKNCSDQALNAVIYSNRAQVNLSMENYGHAWADCQAAVKCDEKNVKAYFRGAKAAHALGKNTEAAAFCRRGLGYDPQNKELKDLYAKIHAARKQEVSHAQQKAYQNWNEQQLRQKTLQAIATAGIQCGPAAFDSVVVQQGFKSNARWCDDVEGPNGPHGELVFAVLFLYPQFFQSDFVQNVAASHCLGAHLASMFPPEQPPAPWDRQQAYSIDKFDVFYEAEAPSGLPEDRQLYQVSLNDTLMSILQEKTYVLPGELPVFHVVPRDIPYYKEFVKRYKRAVLLQ